MKQLTNEEKKSYFQTLIYIVAVDGNISEEEDSAIQAVALNLCFTKDEVDHLVKEVKCGKQLPEILSGIKTRSTKLLLIYELITMCYADGEYQPAEKESITNIANLLDIDHKKVAEIENLITEYIAFQQKVNKVLEVNQ